MFYQLVLLIFLGCTATAFAQEERSFGDTTDDFIENRIDNLSPLIGKQLQDSFSSKLGNLSSYPQSYKIDKNQLEALKVNRITDLSISSEANRWDIEGNSNIYFQNSLKTRGNLGGIPIWGEATLINNVFYNNANDQRLIYHLGYTRQMFLEKLKLKKQDLNAAVIQREQSGNQINLQEMIKTNLTKDSSLNKLVSEAGCNWNDILTMPKNEFDAKYNPQLKPDNTEGREKLKKYYTEYRAKSTKDSLIIAERIKSNDSSLAYLKDAKKKYKQLLVLKRKVEALSEKMSYGVNEYREKAGKLLQKDNSIDEIVNSDNSLSKFQKFMLKVKGVNIGQHTVNTNDLALQSYIQNGVTFEYENNRYSILLTKGSQKKLEYSSAFFPVSSQGKTVTEYYQYNSRYNLTGVSLRLGNLKNNFQQVSFMNFNKYGDSTYPALLAQSVNVVSFSDQYSVKNFKVLGEISKSITSNTNATEADKNYKINFFSSIAFEIKMEQENVKMKEKQKLSILYNSDLYNNPGLYGGNIIPGTEITHSITTALNKKIKFSNQASYSSFTYGNTASLESLRDKIDISYKVKKSRLGIMISGNEGTQSQIATGKERNDGLDVLATGQFTRTSGHYFLNSSNGLGYGYNREDMFGKVKSLSFFTNNSINWSSFSVGLNIDKFNSRNSEVFFTDSTALILESTLNIDSYISFNDKTGNVIQAGMEYKRLNALGNQLYVTGNYRVLIFKRLGMEGRLRLPVSTFKTVDYINNTFNAKLIYNIIGHVK